MIVVAVVAVVVVVEGVAAAAADPAGSSGVKANEPPEALNTSESPKPSAQAAQSPMVMGRWPVFTQMVQPPSLQGRCPLPGGLRSQVPAG